MGVTSPLTGNNDTKLIAELENKRIIQQYQADLGMDISSLPEEAFIYQRNEGGLKFYHPVAMAGDKYLYEELAKKEHYYSKWKWEYSVASEFISAYLLTRNRMWEWLFHQRDKKRWDQRSLEYLPAFFLGIQPIKLLFETGNKITINVVKPTSANFGISPI